MQRLQKINLKILVMGLSKNVLVIALICSICSCGNTEENDKPEDKDCQFDDGDYSADVEYNNPDTGYSATYALNVEVKDCELLQIDFPNGGYLDDDYIEPGTIDEDGDASIIDKQGKDI
jgi:hypothetical protein